ncbi:MAG: class I SAM-dependent methyltransferase, partial [Myxococcaceae bacterium]
TVQWAVSRRQFDRDSEYLIYRSMLGSPVGPVVDLGCGTGLFARKLARDPAFGCLIGVDVSRAMIEEGVAQAREHGVMVDFVRGEAPFLPFQDRSLGAVLQSGSLHFIEDAARLFNEISRALRPGGRYLASTYLPPRFPGTVMHRGLGLYPRGEDELRSEIAAAGLVNFERLLMPPFILVKAEKPR